ncbi:MAG TPA: DUF302 domain-containing protein [Steroidobacteraceae bacterium]|nr:DUF302 domain-containing protein [Steroidobacteraceae bacterium]
MSSTVGADAGFVRIASRYSVPETVTRLEALLKEHGIVIFARIDFCADAARAGLTMQPEQLLLFGNPKAGTPLLQSEPTVGLDLPLKALVWQDADGGVTLAYNDPQYVLQRHGLPQTLRANIAGVIGLLQRAAGA